MGGAFTGVADDATAFYWNPAGIAFGPFVSAGVFHGRDEMDRDGRRFEDRATGLSLQYTFMGVAFAQFRQDLSEGGASRRLDTSDLAVSILQSLPVDNLVLGGNVHYLRGTTQTDAEPEVSSQSWDVDLGLVYEPNDRVRIGLMMRRLREASFRTASEDDGVRLSRHVRAGASWRLPRALLVAFDADLSEQGTGADTWRETSIGMEKGWFEDRAFVRGGLRVEIGSELGARPDVSFGGGVQFWVLEVEGAYVGSSGLRDEAYWFGVSLAR